MAIKTLWRLDDASWTTCTDALWYKNGTYTGSPTLWSQWILNKAVTFWASKYVTTALTDMNSNDFTIREWVYSTDTNDQIWFGSSAWTWWGIRYWNSAGKLAITILWNLEASSSVTLDTNKRIHVMMTRIWNDYIIYYNSKPVVTKTKTWNFWSWNFQLSWAVWANYNLRWKLDNCLYDSVWYTPAKVKNDYMFVKGYM